MEMTDKELAEWISAKVALWQSCQSDTMRKGIRQELADAMCSCATRIARALAKSES